MNLIALDFWTIVILALGLIGLGLAIRLIRFLAILSDAAMGILTQLGMRAVVKVMLAVLVGYDLRTYAKSRFTLWNQVPFRFSLLWGGFIIMTGLLSILKFGNKVDSVGNSLLLVLLVYLAIRCLLCWIDPYSRQGAKNSSIQDVNEQYPRSTSLVRRWDYLDDLFS